MKKKIVLVCLAAMALGIMAGCKEKRCSCITQRINERPAHSLEPLGNHKNCSELDREWMSSDSTHEMLMKTCVEEE